MSFPRRALGLSFLHAREYITVHLAHLYYFITGFWEIVPCILDTYIFDMRGPERVPHWVFNPRFIYIAPMMIVRYSKVAIASRFTPVYIVLFPLVSVMLKAFLASSVGSRSIEIRIVRVFCLLYLYLPIFIFETFKTSLTSAMDAVV
ncbi:hypothetical protein BGX38DRAFT_116219 [Terfezia claveryi]|nr:hypothetical protein BGX38DRAFT_116219 [Terfezia claveryi]